MSKASLRPLLKLPIDSELPKVLAAITASKPVVLEATPGAGKTTRVPPALLALKDLGERQIWVLEPRRLAARASAARVAYELGCMVGEQVGYQIRFDSKAGPTTRVLYLTEGVFLRKLASDPLISECGVLVLDEFHERSALADFALSVGVKLRAEDRPDLGLIVMSATLDSGALLKFLPDAAHVRSVETLHPVEHRYTSPPSMPGGTQSTAQLEHQMRAIPSVVNELWSQSEDSVLVFLPGMREILRVKGAIESLNPQIKVMLLHGELEVDEQAAAISRESGKRVVLATNVAETSITVQGVRSVVDTGWARRAIWDPASGLTTLTTAKISRASAIQRAGRAGREGPGLCVRLYTQNEFSGRVAIETPEITRTDLTTFLLELKGVGWEFDALNWLDAPPPQSWDRALSRLIRLGALNEQGAITERGRKLLGLSLDPRLARTLEEASALGYTEECARLCAVLERGEIPEGEVTLDELLRCEVDSVLVSRLRQEARKLESAGTAVIASATALGGGPSTPKLDRDTALLRALLAGQFERLARWDSENEEWRRANGGRSKSVSVQTHPRHEAVALVLADRADRVATTLEVPWELLLDLTPSPVEEWEGIVERDRAQPLWVSEWKVGDLILDRSERTLEPAERVKVQARQWFKKTGATSEPLQQLKARLALLIESKILSDADSVAGGTIDALTDSKLIESVEWALASSSQLEPELWVRDYVQNSLDPDWLKALEAHAPSKLTMSDRRALKIHYGHPGGPFVESWIQDFFGLSALPSLCAGRVKLTARLLAPNKRAEQITQDLAGFWVRGYEELKGRLSRRYPRHNWPEDPKSAQPILRKPRPR